MSPPLRRRLYCIHEGEKGVRVCRSPPVWSEKWGHWQHYDSPATADEVEGLLAAYNRSIEASVPKISRLDLVAFAGGVVAAARVNVPDCRLHYVEVQFDKEEIDELARDLGLPPIDWHPETCKHAGTKWTVGSNGE